MGSKHLDCAKLDNGYQNLCSMITISKFLVEDETQISVIKRKFRLVCSRSPCFRARPTQKPGAAGRFHKLLLEI